MSSDYLILDLGADIKGNCIIANYVGKIVISSYSHNVSLPLQGDPANTERTAGRPTLSEMSIYKQSDLSTCELYKACSQGSKIGTGKLYVGRVEKNKFMNFFTYEMTNVMISSISTSGGGGLPSDSFSLNFTALKCDFTQQATDTTEKGNATWNWNAAELKTA